jgi:hypothetical protein
VASRCACLLSLTASTSRSTSCSVRCSRVRSSVSGWASRVRKSRSQLFGNRRVGRQPQARSRQGNLLGFGRDWSVAGPSMMSTVIGGGITGNGLRDGNQVPETVRGAPGREVGSHRPRTGSTASWATVGPRVSALGTEAITRRVLIRPSGPASGLTLGRSEARRIASEMIRRRTHPGCSEDTRRNGSRPPIAP